jgi:hemin uptake protein HemP
MRIILIHMNQTSSPITAFASSSASSSTQESHVDSRQPRAITSETLLAGSKELVIKHAGRDYHLRLTKLGKLILTA